jgi:GMP synthase-like glutamine amidotransferase
MTPLQDPEQWTRGPYVNHHDQPAEKVDNSDRLYATMAPVTGLVLQTQPDATSGQLLPWAASRGLIVDAVRVDLGEPLPEPRELDFAVALGSDASLADGGAAWIAEEVEWLRAADAADVPVIGIGFGAQALAVALGARVYRLPEPENGWVEIETLDPHRVPAGPWPTWHRDGFELPPLAYALARNAYGVQAFCHRHHLAVQFHPEAAAVADARRVFDGFAARAGLRLARA